MLIIGEFLEMSTTKSIKIGITSQSDKNLFGNGLTQNIWFLFRILKNSGYDVSLVAEQEESIGNYLITEQIKPLNAENLNNFDLIIECAYSLSTTLDEKIKDSGIVRVGIQYGNRLIIDLESIIFDKNYGISAKSRIDEIWCSPHFKFSMQPIETFNKTEVKICPYVWSPDVLIHKLIRDKLDPFFKQTTNINNLSFFEPNLNVLKTCLVPLAISEDLYLRRPELINKIYAFNTSKLKNNKSFIQRVTQLKIQKEAKIFYEKRFSFIEMLNDNNAGVVISHHWMNGLNYLQLEAMYFGTPIVHNSEFFKDHGYYYPEWDSKEGSRQLEIAIETHKDNFLQERGRDREKLWEFHPDNPKNIEGYVELIENALAKHLRK
jgi:hypothetical protein